MKRLTVQIVEERIKLSSDEWVGNCHAVASKVLKNGIVKGKLRYGHYLGYVKKGTMFYNKGIVRHGWIEMQDGTIVDFTRWVFDGRKPYIFVGKSDGEYDAGGQVWRKAVMSPPPEFDDSLEVEFKVSDETRDFILNSLSHPYITKAGLFWIANLSVDTLGKYAKDIYKELKRIQLGVLVPIDNYRLVME